jgi:NADH pyrophosphatase NudC (nudix superfamily)
MTNTQTGYTPGQIIEYTSFDESGYTIGQVVRYADASEQTRVCPNCGQLAVPDEGPEGSLRRCPRCRAHVRFPALDPLVYIRSRSGGKPFPVRETQIRPRTSK